MNDGVRVALLVEQLMAPVPGGIGRYARDLAEALDSTCPEGCSVSAWTARHRGGVPALPATLRGAAQLPVGRRSLALLWERGLGPVPRPADVVHAPSLLMPPRRGTALVVTIHDTVPWSHPHVLTRRGVAFHRKMAQRAVRQADAVVVPTMAVARRVDELFASLSAERVHVVPNGLAPGLAELLAREQAGDDERAAGLALPPGGFWLFVGTREPRKDLGVLVRALADTQSRLPLLVAGPGGWGNTSVARDVAQAGLGDDVVRVLGHVSDQELALLYRRSVGVVVPSQAEGYGYPVVEAMAAAAPVVVSDDAALLETSGTAALSFPVGDHAALAMVLDRLAGDGKLRAELGEAGRRHVARATTVAAARQLWDLYRSLG